MWGVYIFWLCALYVVDLSLHSFKVVDMVFKCMFENKIKKELSYKFKNN